MNQVLKRLWVGVACCATACLLTSYSAKTAFAQSRPEPAIVISIADLASQIKDVDYLLEAAGYGQMKFMAQSAIKQYTKGLNTKMPAGIFLYAQEDRDQPDVLGFISVSSLDDFLDTLAGVAEIDETGDLTKIMTDNGTEVLLKQVGDHVFLSDKKELLEDTPVDPVAMLGELPKLYNLSAKVFVQRVPASMRENFIDTIRESYEQELERLSVDEEDEEELSVAERTKEFDEQIQEIAMMLNQTESVTLASSIDKESKTLFTDFELAALPDSDFAKRIKSSQLNEKSRFEGFLIPGAAFTHQFLSALSPEDKTRSDKSLKQVKDAIAEGLSDQEDFSESEIELIQKSANNLLDVIQQTMAAGRIETGAVVKLDEKNPNVAAAMVVADPAKVEATLVEIMNYAESEYPDLFQVEMNSSTHNDVAFHRVIVQVPADKGELREFVGNEAIVTIGIGKDAVYFGAGVDPLPLLTEAIDGGKTERVADPDRVTMQHNFYLAPILKFIASVQGDPMTQKMADELAIKGKDRIRIDSNIVQNRFKVHFEIQDGILSLIKVGIENALGGGAFPGGENDF